LIGVLAEKDLKPLSQKARPLMPLGSSLASSAAPIGPCVTLCSSAVVVEDVGEVEDLELLDPERAELGQRGRQHVHRAKLQGFQLFLVLVKRAVGIDLNFGFALGQLCRFLGKELRGLALGRIGSHDMAELDDDWRLGQGDGGKHGGRQSDEQGRQFHFLWLEQNLRFHLIRNEELLGRIASHPDGQRGEVIRIIRSHGVRFRKRTAAADLDWKRTAQVQLAHPVGDGPQPWSRRGNGIGTPSTTELSSRKVTGQAGL
jgi:hypothetical protein